MRYGAAWPKQAVMYSIFSNDSGFVAHQNTPSGFVSICSMIRRIPARESITPPIFGRILRIAHRARKPSPSGRFTSI